MTMILDLLRDAFTFSRIPDSYYEAKKTISKLCLDYIKIDACPNDCMLFLGNDANEKTCKYCHTSRWKPIKKRNEDLVSATGKEKIKKKTKKPAKILRYFPLKPRLQRLFMCSKIAKHMRWHAEDGDRDGVTRHPRDGITRDQWTSFVNYRYKEETQNMCKRNAENRKKQTVPHTGGSKPNSRRRAEMMAETGSKPRRAQLYLAIHTKKDASYVNEQAKEICSSYAVSGLVSPTNTRRSSGASNPSDNH
ncbi:uncharacterized protein LOC107832067 isoform X1 [Nicotiana tabacum]|uniref:Uncharacterized protein LOC107832067 isoform X1 n=1 Tax=Nicotiana tabacum TaxID=4097 RepID=A0AC58U189_TOBAC